MATPARTALVTGAGRGIGRGIALGLARAGWAVVLAGRTRAHLDVVAAECRAAGADPENVVVVAGDLVAPGTAALVVETAERACARLGGIGLLVNNAGVVERSELPFGDDDPDDMWRVIETNVRGPLLMTHAVLPGMLARGGGRVVTISSGAAHRATDDYTGYAISKGAVSRLTRLLDHQYRASGLRAFDLAPGVVATDMTAGMPVHGERVAWTPVEKVAAMVLAIGAGELDVLSGRFVHAGFDTAAELALHADRIIADDARVLRLVTYGPDDPAV